MAQWSSPNITNGDLRKTGSNSVLVAPITIGDSLIKKE
jgi:bifunctional N-acetylglucosamine-1-phosphate-uridyltransferase/glucosamine-1-phosphate-acetyltransferase GlmU-like protein